MDQFWILLFDFLQAALLLFAMAGIKIGIDWLRGNTTATQRALIASFASDAVEYAQETFGKQPGAERYQEALKALTGRLKENNINISEDDLEIYIQSSVKKLRKEFGEEWYRE